MLGWLAAVDPLSVVLWSVAALAAGMYPIGIMLGSSCSPCCESQEPCGCDTGTLPETVTATFKGMDAKVPGVSLLNLNISAPFGSGATGDVSAPFGDPEEDAGPIASVTLLEQGSGYAVVGRVPPVITAFASGTGADLSVVLDSTKDGNGIPTWSVKEVKFSKPGVGYSDFGPVTLSATPGDTVVTAATAIIRTAIEQPIVTASATGGGTGAEIAVTLSPNNESPPTRWEVASLSLIKGGTGYPIVGDIAFQVADGDTVDDSALGAYICKSIDPVIELSLVSGSGANAVLKATLDISGEPSIVPYRYISSIEIEDGGTGYEPGDAIIATVLEGQENWPLESYVSEVDGNGSITSVSIADNGYPGGLYRNTNGVIESLNLVLSGSYYRSIGAIREITVTNSGKYYREDKSVEPYVANVSVTVEQIPPSNGTDAKISATVDDDTNSPSFGQIVSLELEDAGDGYLARELFDGCFGRFDDRTVVLKAVPGVPCLYRGGCKVDESPTCTLLRERYQLTLGAQSGFSIEYDYWPQNPNPGTNPTLKVAPYKSLACNTMDCSELTCDGKALVLNATENWPSSAPLGSTVELAAGGKYEEADTCCTVLQEDLEEFQITLKLENLQDMEFSELEMTLRLDGIVPDDRHPCDLSFPVAMTPPGQQSFCGDNLRYVLAFVYGDESFDENHPCTEELRPRRQDAISSGAGGLARLRSCDGFWNFDQFVATGNMPFNIPPSDLVRLDLSPVPTDENCIPLEGTYELAISDTTGDEGGSQFSELKASIEFKRILP